MDYYALVSSVFYFMASFIVSKRLFSNALAYRVHFTACISIAFFAHFSWLYQHIFLVSGQNLPMLNVLSMITFIIAVLSTLAHKRFNTGVLLPVVYAFCILTFIIITYLPSHYITHLERNPLIGTHILFALLAYSVLTIASLFALQLAYLNHYLKRPQLIKRKLSLPPLMTLEKSLFQFILIGFILLSCTLLTGFFFLEHMFYKENAHKAVLTLFAWVIYAVLLWGHFKRGWRGRMTIYITIAASSLLTLAYFGSRFVREIILS
ncbi:cytochrome c assembly protein [Psychromonas sp. CNPT3]|uniref:cytochrome C assembly family protein n=1 Tax=Psychromonas sp. CNPT3 TaxID=314282 RepID=UPI00006E98FC|nr:cytochrome c biogenesis protein CcsA [Psychromonas sp. CNPT3]AGH82289.1 cytochrome c assembly protein [Psychromonas sp. CNPT3]